MALWSSVRRKLEPKRSWSQRSRSARAASGSSGGVRGRRTLQGFCRDFAGPHRIPEVGGLGGHHSDLAGDSRSSKPPVFLQQGNHISDSLGIGLVGFELVAELHKIALSLALSSASRSFSLSICEISVFSRLIRCS